MSVCGTDYVKLCLGNFLESVLYPISPCGIFALLGDHSLVRLGLLDLITCVGLRYGLRPDNLRSFSWKRALPHFALSDIFALLGFGLEASIRICQDTPL